MIRPQILRVALLGVFALSTMGFLNSSQVYAQRARKPRGAKVCGDPTAACTTTVTVDTFDLPFQIPASGVIWESADFYPVILKSVESPGDNCDTFVPEDERLAAQGLFPRMKVFSSRCSMGGGLFYTNVAQNVQFMAVYAGATKAQADRMLATVNATGKFPGANIRKMHAGFNGT